jgi:hypothetical protein
MRYRVEYLHLTTSGRLIFTVETPGLDGMARSAGNAWLHESGLHLSDFAFLSVVAIGGDGHAHPEAPCCDILSIVSEQYPDGRPVYLRVPVGCDDEHEGASGDRADVLAPRGAEGASPDVPASDAV